MRANKYGARKVTAPDGQKFDSMKEYYRWSELKLMQRAGIISKLERQVKFELIPKQEGELACNYIADFTYYQKGEYIVEDVKGCKTDVYKIKKKLMLWVHGIRIRET